MFVPVLEVGDNCLDEAWRVGQNAFHESDDVVPALLRKGGILEAKQTIVRLQIFPIYVPLSPESLVGDVRLVEFGGVRVRLQVDLALRQAVPYLEMAEMLRNEEVLALADIPKEKVVPHRKRETAVAAVPVPIVV